MKRKVGRKKSKCLESGGKVSYRDEASARRVLNVIRDAGQPDRRMPERVYPCDDCGGWHLTGTSELSGFYAELQRGKEEP